MSSLASKPRILVVEDEAIVARDIHLQLLELGYEPVGHATGGEQAIAMAGALRPDLVLMDIELPGAMDGTAAAQVIHDRFLISVVFLTAFADEDTLARARVSEPFGYILKPFSERELRTVIELALYKHQAELKVRLSDVALKAISQGVLIAGPDQLILSANEAFCSITGYRESEILGRNCRFLQGPLSDAGTVRAIRQALENAVEFSGEVLNYRKDGTPFWNELTISPVRAGQGPVAHFVGVTRDITARKRAEERLRQLNEELERRVAERTAALKEANQELDAFSHSVSHDLRAPLRAISGFGHFLIRDGAEGLDERRRGYLQRMLEAAEQMSTLVDDLLKFAHASRATLHRQPVDLSALAQEVVRVLQQASPERPVEFICAPGLQASGDPRLLRVVLVNLLGNAWKYTGKVTGPRVEFGSTGAKGGQVFFVHDNGAGFDMKYVHRLFGAFQRLHSLAEFEGTGVGLATVHRILTRHGGRIWAEGRLGEGATFYFTLPEVPESTMTQTTDRGEVAPHPTSALGA